MKEPIELQIEDLSHDARGVARHEGKATFVRRALPGERVLAQVYRRKKSFNEAETTEILEASAQRVVPPCPHYTLCSGCSLQHLDVAAQVEAKRKTLHENLRRIGGIEPGQWLDPIRGPEAGYRRKARMSVRYVAGKGRAVVGFRERNGRYIADLESCHVLDARFGDEIPRIAAAIDALEIRDRIPQLELIAGDTQAAMVVRHLAPLSASDVERLRQLGDELALTVYAQPEGPDSLVPLTETPELSYEPEPGIRLAFGPLDFVQVNAAVNRALVAKALALLEVEEHHGVLDLFCGLGNFSLPLARRCKGVVGVEGEAELVDRARRNAERNRLANTSFWQADLRESPAAPWAEQSYDRVLLDPPRSGAQGLIAWLGQSSAKRIVYVSCHPGSFARDAGALVNDHGLSLEALGVADMFPHTNHIESIGLFTRGD